MSLDVLPHLSDVLMATGLGFIALDFLLQEGGAAYIPRHSAALLLCAKKIYAVGGAPQIAHMVYATIPARSRRLPLIVDALSLL